MKRLIRRTLSLLLAVVLCLACGIGVFAAERESAPFQHYFMIGDSISVKEGPGLGPDVRTKPELFRTGTYADLIKKELEISDSRCCAHAGWRVEEALYAIGGEDLVNEWILDDYGGQKKAKLTSMIEGNVAALEKADLITINLGSNNIVATLALALNSAFETENAPFSGSARDRAVLDALKKAKSSLSDYELLVAMLDAVETMDRGMILLQNALKDLPAALKSFPTVWDKLISRIREVNPTAKIVVVGMYNPLGNLVERTINENISLGSLGASLSNGLGDLLNAATAPVVSYVDSYMRCGSRWAKEYVYADVHNVDLTGSIEGVHLGVVGHRYFADQILKVIEKNFICHHEHTEVKNARKASLLLSGYSGDIYCADCGRLLQRGSITHWYK